MVNFPGWLYLSAISTTLFQIETRPLQGWSALDRPVLDDGSGEEEVDLLDIFLAPDPELLGDRQLAQVRAGIVGDSLTVPMYSEWSVTA